MKITLAVAVLDPRQLDLDVRDRQLCHQAILVPEALQHGVARQR